MNDHLLESTKKPRTSNEPLRLNQIESEHSAFPIDNAETPRTPTKNSTAYKVLTAERQAKIKVTFNNIRLVLILSLVPFATILSTFGNVKLFIMASDTTYNFWVNFLFVQKIYIDPEVAIQHNSTNVVYTNLMLPFYYGGCSGEGTDDDPDKLCATMISYYYTGLFASIAVTLGIIFHLIHFWQLARLSSSKSKGAYLVKGFNPLVISYFIIFLYVGSFIYWLFGSATIINSNSSQNPITRFGSAFFCYIAASFVFILVVFWLRRVYRKGIRRHLVNNLLSAEEKYISEPLESFSNDGATERDNN